MVSVKGICYNSGFIQDLENFENLENLENGQGSLENLEKRAWNFKIFFNHGEYKYQNWSF